MNKTATSSYLAMGTRFMLACAFASLCSSGGVCSSGLTAAESVCLTGNAPGQSRNQLKNARYRIVWAGTTQPITLGNPLYRDWSAFSAGPLTDGKLSRLPGDLSQLDPAYKAFSIKYAWPGSGYAIEVDLDQVCQINSFELTGQQEQFVFKVFYPETRRWLPIAKHKTKVTFQNLITRQFRIEAGGFPSPAGNTFSQIRIWGTPLTTTNQNLPPPLPVDDPVIPYKPLDLKPAAESALAADPFVFPEPDEMDFGENRLFLPRTFSVVVAADADPAIKPVADNFLELLMRLVDVECKVQDRAEGPGLWLGLAETSGPGRELAKQYAIDNEHMKAEGYAIQIGRDGVFMVGRDLEGLIWATQTLLFLVRPEASGGISLPMGYVRDFPRSPHRPIHGFPGWRGEFKAGLLQAMITLKNNLVVLRSDEVCTEVIRRNRIRQTIPASLFPGSACGTGGDLLEISPGKRRELLNPARLSACPSHTDFWPGMCKAFPQSQSGLPGQFVELNYDEIMHNPFMVCPRCRGRGLSQREILLDAFLKAYQAIIPRGYNVSIYATGFMNVSRAFDMFLDIPTNNVLIFNYCRTNENTILRQRGLKVIAGSTHTVDITPHRPEIAGIVWNWCSGTRSSMMGQIVPWMLSQSEENWSSFDKQLPLHSPENEARLNRAMSFARHIIDGLPLDIPGLKHAFFSIDISTNINRTLRDDVYGDGKGWLDEGPTRDLRHLPAGKQTFDGIPYNICEGALIVAGPESVDDQNLPDQILDIPVQQQAAELFFLHTCANSVWTGYGRCVVLIGFYRIHYDDDTFVTVPVNYGEHLLEWNRTFNYRKMECIPTKEPASCASAAWRGGTDGGQDVTLYSMRWRNPYPEKKIRSIDVLASAQAESNRNRLCLVAISGCKVEPADITMATRIVKKPALRPYRRRPSLPAGMEAIDLIRLSTPPLPLLPISIGKGTSWTTADQWISAAVPSSEFEKRDYFFGVYSALHPDDNAWLGNGPLTIKLKRLAPLRGIGIKGRMQSIYNPEFFPARIEVSVQKADNTWVSTGMVKDHVGQEGEERWIFPQEMEVAQVRINVISGGGLSAVYLYGKPLGSGRIEIERPPTADEVLSGKDKKKSEEDILDLLEGR